MLALMGGVFFGFCALVYTMRALRRRARRAADAPLPPAFDLLELRRLLETAKISAEEFERLRAIVEARNQLASGQSVKSKGFEVLPLEERVS